MANKTLIATLVGETFVPAAGFETISYVGGKVAGTAGQGGGSIDLTTGLTGGSGGAPLAGDLVVVTVSVGTAARQPTIAIATPTGYTALTAQRTTASAIDANVQTCYKIMGGTPDTAVTIPASGNAADGIAYTIQVFRGIDPTTPMDTAATFATGSGTNNRPDPASITPSTAGAWIVICGGGAAGTGTTLFTAAYLTNFLTANGADTNDGTVGSGYLTWTSGAYDGAAFGGGNVNAANSWGCTTLALRPKATTPFPDARQAAIEGVVSAQSETNGWNAERPDIPVTALVRTSDTVITLTIPSLPNYEITAQEVLTWTLPGSILTGGSPIVATPTFTIDEAGAGAYSLDAAPGSYSATGVLAGAASGRALNAVAGALAMTGIAATLAAGLMTLGAPGSYALTGAPAAIVANRSLNAAAGAFAATGIAATLSLGRFLNTAPGVYTLTGLAATLFVGRALAALPGAYVITGAAATLLAARMLNAVSGSYALTGILATLAAGRALNAIPGAYVLTGTAASLVAGKALNAAPGVYVVTGTLASLISARALNATPGVYVITGVEATLFYGALIPAYVLDAQPGAIVVTGFAASPVASRAINAALGAYALTGTLAGTIADRKINAAPGVYSLTGFLADLLAGSSFVHSSLDAAPGVYVVTGSVAQLARTYGFFAEPGVYVITGRHATAGITVDEFPVAGGDNLIVIINE